MGLGDISHIINLSHDVFASNEVLGAHVWLLEHVAHSDNNRGLESNLLHDRIDRYLRTSAERSVLSRAQRVMALPKGFRIAHHS
jgi:hypothetical protein